jgi:hypothetical protein
MKKIVMMMVALLSIAGMAGCTKCSPSKMKEMVSSAPKELTVDEIGKTLAPAICGKYETCNKDNAQFNKDQCLQEIATGITENLKTAANLKVTQEALDGCKKSIEAAACDALNSSAPPTGCEFLQ